MTLTLAIETSCDDTAVAVIKDGKEILSNIVSSQIKQHAQYGGVVPELASRLHTEKINSLINLALKESNRQFNQLTAVAVTMGPGLEGALLIGMTVAKTIAATLNIPLIPVNHLKGHIFAHLADHAVSYPFMSLIVSGGHTQLVHVISETEFNTIGKTRDDAAGEVFDKVARALGLGYPGGPIIEQKAALGDKTRFSFPIPMKHDGLDFSFSGLKTALIQHIQSFKDKDESVPIEDTCASFQDTVAQTLTLKTIKACRTYNVKRLVLGGGVIANQYIVSAFKDDAQKNNIELITIPKILCTDNAAMIGLAATHLPLENYSGELRVQPGLKL
tara:strand:- start:1083 stop:2075 length:993 start_codon:yes stop_codon:yes gene_type:complete